LLSTPPGVDVDAAAGGDARPHPAWLAALISQGLPIYCGFDADPTGDAMAQRMHDLHPSILRLSPAAKDWNDHLLQLAR
jgi:hypothetical protein